MAFNSFPITKRLLIITLISLTLLFFLLISPTHYPSSHRRTLLTIKCHLINGQSTLLNYTSFHTCLFSSHKLLSVPFLTLTLLLHFYILVKTAQDRFSVVVTKLSTHLNLSPSMGAVTLLALGNGAPDVFASVAAVRGGQARTGFGAILSAGTFVSAFVVGFVAIYAAPFSVDPAPFVRDVLFYLTAALFLFYVYLSAEIYLWQAVGFVCFYVFFVGIVFSMDLGYNAANRGKEKVGSPVGGGEVGLVEMDCESGEMKGGLGVVNNKRKSSLSIWEIVGKV